MDNIVDFMGQYLEVDVNKITDFLNEQEEYPYSFDDVIDEFLEIYDIDIEQLNPEKIIFSGIHITTNNDQCESIKKYGLLDTQQALMVDTPLRRMLSEHGLEFDFKEDKVFYTEPGKAKKTFDLEEFFIERNAGFVLGKLKGEGNYPINAFMKIDDYTAYGGNVHEKPEIIRDISKAVDRNIQTKWCNPTNKYVGYAIKFYAPFNSCNFSHWYNNEIQQLDDADEGYILFNRKLLIKCIEAYLQPQKQEFLFLKREVYVPFEDIYEIIHIDSNEPIYSRDN